jgi:hypothetical protein
MVTVGMAFLGSRYWQSMVPPSGDRNPYRAWQGPAGETQQDVRLWALSYALLAPNPHNLQPWKIHAGDDNTLTLRHDARWLLPETDPFARQLTIGHGAFLELLRMAAAERGYALKVKLFPEGQEEDYAKAGAVVAQVAFTPGQPEKDPLFAQVLNRRTDRDPYDMAKPVSAVEMATVLGKANPPVTMGMSLAGQPQHEALTNLAREAYRVELSVPRIWKESVDVMQVGEREISLRPYGIALRGNMIALGKTFGALTHEEMLPVGSSANKIGLEKGSAAITASPAFGWITTRGNTRAQQILAGSVYVRQHLQATALGMTMQPLSQALQEFPEMAEVRAAMNVATATPAGATLQMFYRLGHPMVQVPPAPRRPLASLMV